MAIKGLAYVKTSWAFEERPVASSKLNMWDDRIEAAIEDAIGLVHFLGGARDGVWRVDDDALKVRALAAAGMSVEVLPGRALIDRSIYRLDALTETVDVAAPAALPRIDLVQASLENWNVRIRTGTEGANPAAPSAEAGCLPLAALYLRPAMTQVKNADDGLHGYIIDVRPFL